MDEKVTKTKIIIIVILGILLIWKCVLVVYKELAPIGEVESIQTEITPTPATIVTKVVDGDTIKISTGETIRYIGIDTPETIDPRQPVQCYGHEASAKNKELVEGKTVTLEKDVSEADRFGRLLRYVWVDGKMVNEILVEEGFAHASAYPPDIKHQERFESLELKARSEQKGLWDNTNCPNL